MGYIAYGGRVTAFSVDTGAVLSRWLGEVGVWLFGAVLTCLLCMWLSLMRLRVPCYVGRCPAYSVSVTPGGEALYVQSLSTALWRVAITGNATNVTLTGSWSCIYNSTGKLSETVVSVFVCRT